MDENNKTNNPAQTTTGTTPPPPPVQPPPTGPGGTGIPTPPLPQQPTNPTQTSAPTPPMPDSGEKGNKTTLILVGLVIVMAVIVGIIYFLAIQSGATGGNQPEITPIPQQQVATPTPSPSPTIAPEQIDEIETGDPTNDLEKLNEELDQL